jgi:hypothetical protein
MRVSGGAASATSGSASLALKLSALAPEVIHILDLNNIATGF